MPTTRGQLDEANTLSLEYDRITAALNIVQAGPYQTTLTVSRANPPTTPSFTFGMTIASAVLTDLLNARKAEITARLLVLGITA